MKLRILYVMLKIATKAMKILLYNRAQLGPYFSNIVGNDDFIICKLLIKLNFNILILKVIKLL